ncbi:MAG TPA: lactonase family protein [Rariglobus sp.]|jgi:6-phosphogluconolactonase|nr:lactonase family protein [Rariglobus sp.]
MRLRLLVSLFVMTATLTSARELLVYVGTYTGKASKGIYVGRLDSDTGQFGAFTLATEAANPSFLTVSPDKRHLYAVSEISSALYAGQPSGLVNAFAIDSKTGLLTPIGHAASGGRDPCHLSISPDGKTILVANYSSGTVAMLPVLPDGGVGEPSCVIHHEGHGGNPSRQKEAHAHAIILSPDGGLAYAADLGTDKVYIYRVNASANTLAPVKETILPPGSGPRHLALNPDKHHAYLINELANTITVFTLASAGETMAAIQTVPTLPAGFTGNSTTAEIVVHPSGRFIYGSNRGHDSIAVFSVDSATGKLTPVETVPTQGKTPRNIVLDPTGHWLIAANQDSNSLVVFSVDQTTGRLTPTGQNVPLGSPVCIEFP